MDLKRKAINGVKWNTVATVYKMLAELLKLSVLTYLLEKSDFGLVAIATMIISFTNIFSDLGVTVAIIHKQDITKRQYSSIFWLNIIVNVIVFLLVCVSSPFFASFYNESLLIYIIPLLGLQILFNAFGKMFQTIKTKNIEFGFISKVKILSVTVGFIVTVLMAYLGFGVFSLVLGQLIQVLLNQLVYSIVGMREQKVLLHFDLAEIKDVLTIGGFQMGAKFLDFLSSKIDVFLIGRFFGMEDLGIYNLAKELIYKPCLIINSLVSNVASATFAKLQDNIEKVRESYSKLVKIVAFIALPIYASTFVFSDLIVQILYSEQFSDVSTFLQILSVLGVFVSVDGISSTLIIAFGRTELGMKWTLIRVVISILVIYFSSCFSIYMVAIGQAFVAIICYVLYWKYIVNRLVYYEFKEYVGLILQSILLTVFIGFPFILILNLCDVSMVCQMFMFVLFFVVYLFLQRQFVKSFLLNIIKN